MFVKIFLFEVQNRLRRPAVYLYFLAALVFTVFTFSTGSLPVGEKEHINSPYLISLWCAGITMFMTLISSFVMGTPLYRDIEYNTKDYYLTYPITKAGYFWGRYLGSFLFMLFIGSAVIIGAYLGAKLGPAMGWTIRDQYGPNNLSYYLYPFFTIAVPNLIFTSSLFFGLVALTRDVKVIYSGGILLFLGYFLSLFFLNNTSNITVITLADPFALSAIRLQTSISTFYQQNTSVISLTGAFLLNRFLWAGIGILVLLYTYIRFNFEKFFSGKRDKNIINIDREPAKQTGILKAKISFTGRYNRSTLFSLTKVELLNIFRDNYFWIIVSSGMVFLGFVFWMGNQYNGVPDLPRTVMLFNIFNDVFLFFIFFIIVFYTGETLHRDRVTRYAFINDSLPPPNWVLNGSKLISLLLLGAGLSLIPVVLALFVQIAKGFHLFNFPVYFLYTFMIIIPRLLEMVVFAYLMHVVLNNKFVAHGAAAAIWIAFYFLEQTHIFDYNLLVYSYTPWFGVSDMDGIGHMAKSVNCFNLYWMLFAGLLIILSALFYYRGVTSSFKERLQLIGERFDNKTRLFTGILMLTFLSVGAYNYYNVSYLNNFLTDSEKDHRAVIYERTLKHFDSEPLPKVIRIKMNADLFPDRQQEFVKAFVTIQNKTNKPILTMLLDGDELTDYSIKRNGEPVSFTCPLVYKRGMFNWFRPKRDTAEFRLYKFDQPLAPGDSAVLEVNSSISYRGFSNSLYSGDLLHNGITFKGGLPGLGYDDDDELSSNYERRKNHLPEKKEEEIAQNDPAGISTLKAGRSSDLLSVDLTVSTSADQTAIAPGELEKQWKQTGRNFFHYVQNKPGMYAPLGIISARYAVLKDSVQLGHKVAISIYYHPAHNINISRFMAAYKDGLNYFSKAYGEYPFSNIKLAETPIYSSQISSLSTLDAYAEYFAWNAGFTKPNQVDYCYFTTARLFAQQWWRFQVAPNNTAGSMVIPEGLSSYSALVLMEQKYGKNNMKGILQDEIWPYLAIRRRMNEKEVPLIRANQWFEWGGKAAIVMYGLKDLMGEDSLNSALRDFKNAYAFKSKPPYAGTNDLYRYLQKHTPDSLQYYLTDTWQKITLYNNSITGVKAIPTGKNNQYKVTISVKVAKAWINDKGNDSPATKMNDYIDIGVFSADTKNKDGRTQVNPLYLKKYKLGYGKHIIEIVVNGKPVRAGIDPYNKLIDRIPDDNMKDF